MKIVRASAPDLWVFAKTNLPSSLSVYSECASYGTVYGIDVHQNTIGGRLKAMLPLTSGIAYVGHDFINLFDPKYFSDMEDLLRKYETKYGKEATLYFCDEAKGTG